MIIFFIADLDEDETNTQFSILDLSALKKQCLIFFIRRWTFDVQCSVFIFNFSDFNAF